MKILQYLKKMLYNEIFCLYLKISRTEFIAVVETRYDVIGEKNLVLLSALLSWKLLMKYLRHSVTLKNNSAYNCPNSSVS